MRAEEDIIGILPLKIGTLLKERLLKEQIYEIRIKIGKPILVYSKYGEHSKLCTNKRRYEKLDTENF